MISPRKSIRLPYILYPAWAAAVFAYYFYNNPRPPVELFRAAAGFFFIAAAGFGAGITALRLLKLRTSAFLEEFAVSGALGLGILYIVTLALGAAGLFSSTAAFTALGILLLATLRNLKAWVRDFSGRFRYYSHNRFSLPGAVFFTAFTIFTVGLTLAFLNSFAPPVSEYQLSVSLAAAQGYSLAGLGALSGNYTANLPPGMFMLYTLGYLVGGAASARLVTFMFLLILACGIYSLTRKYYHSKTALLAAAAAVSTPALIRFYLIDHPFLASCCYGFMAFYAYLCWAGPHTRRDENSWRWLILSGAFTGFSISFGYYSMFTPMILILMISWRLAAGGLSRGFQGSVNRLAMFLLPFVVVLLPMLIKNYVLAGTPLFPFFYSVADAAPLAGRASSLWGELLPMWYIPFESSLKPGNFYLLGPVLFILIPGLLMVKEFGKTMRNFFVYTALYLVMFAAAGRRIAMFYPLVPFLSIISAYTAVSLFGRSRFLYRFIAGIFFASIAVNIYTALPLTGIGESVTVAIGHGSRSRYLEARVPGYPAAAYISENTASDSYILLAGDAATFYMNRRVEARQPFSRDPLSVYIEKGRGAAGALGLIRDEGFTYMVIKPADADSSAKTGDPGRWRYGDRTVIEEITGELREVFSNGGYLVYEL